MQKIITGIFIFIISTAVCFGQKQKQDPDTFEEPQKQSKKETVDPKLGENTSLEAALSGTLDVRKSEVGDEVVLKTTKSVKQNGEVIIPKGTRLIGRVTEVQEKSENNLASKISVVFERLEGKNLSAPVTATIVSVLEARGNAGGGVFDADAIGSSSSRATASGSGAGGGLLGGVTNSVGGAVNSVASTAGGIANTAGQASAGTAGNVARSVAGLQISQSAHASANGSTTLSANNKNIRLDKGATFLLLVSGFVDK